MRGGFSATIALLMALAACGGGADDGLLVSDARIGEPTGPNAALYLTVRNNTDGADVLEGASTDIAEAVELHETIENDDGTMGMQPVDAQLEVASQTNVRLEPGGLHLMLIDVERLEVGETVVVTLQWQNAGEIEVEAEVVEPQEAVEHEDEDHG